MNMLRASERPALWVGVAVIGVILVTGCQPTGNEYSGPTGTVNGKVTLNGTAVPEGCRVAFVSDAGHTASGAVGADGAYQLNVVKAGGGSSSDIPVATYKVSVGPPSGEEMSDADYDAMMEQSSTGDGDAPAAAETTIPDKYQAAATSELSFDVTEGANTIDIELE